MANRIFYHIYNGEGAFVRSFASEEEAREYLARQGELSQTWTIRKIKRGIYV